jgi:hypothetical protein
VSGFDSTSKRGQLFKVAGGFYGFVSDDLSVWFHSCFSERITGMLTVKGPPFHQCGG